MLTRIVEYSDVHRSGCEPLLNELQSYLIFIDEENVQIMPPQYTSDYMNHVIAKVSDNNGKIFVGTLGKDIMGLVAGCIKRKDAEDLMTTRCPIRGIIMELVVSSVYRNKGVGELLLKTMEEYFLKSGCEFIAIDVFSPNTTALRFYENRGYAPRNVEIYKRIIFDHSNR